MKRLIGIVLALVMIAAFGITALAGDSQPASKATAKVGNLAWLTTEDTWVPILTQTIKTANQKDLFVDVSLRLVSIQRQSSLART